MQSRIDSAPLATMGSDVAGPTWDNQCLPLP